MEVSGHESIVFLEEHSAALSRARAFRMERWKRGTYPPKAVMELADALPCKREFYSQMTFV